MAAFGLRYRIEMRTPATLLFVLSVAASAQEISGELKQWHDVVLTFDGPETDESAAENPFFAYRLDVTFSKGAKKMLVPGYFAADGDAAETSATGGNKWRAHFVPDETGEWSYSVSFRTGPEIAVADDASAGRPLPPDGRTGAFTVEPSDKRGRDHRAHGMLRYVGERYARYQGSGRPFIQIGAQSPENFLAYYELDATVDHGGAENRLADGLHRYEAHVQDWRPGDPVWQGGKGRGIIGALNYLAAKGMNTFYSLTMNVGGDGREIYPWTSYDERVRYDVSKLAQWEIVMSHMDRLGMQLMLITQEEENEQILGKMTPLRKLYYRELVARFAHHHALLWDLSEEADRWRYNSGDDLKAMCDYIKRLDPWDHPVQYVQWKGELLPDDVGYGRLLGFKHFDGAALQHDPEFTHPATKKWVDASAAAGHKWLVGLIEINPTSTGVVPDSADYWHDRVRKNSLWGNLMAGGSGPVFFFGYAHPNSDLDLEDWRSRDRFWDLLRHAHQFFTRFLPFDEMHHADDLTPDTRDFVLAKPGEVYAVYLPNGGAAELDLSGSRGEFDVRWYDPRWGGELQTGTVGRVRGGGKRSLGEAPADRLKDWAVLIRQVRKDEIAVGRSLLVKLRNPVGSSGSRAGDRIEASLISPETHLGGFLEGTVQAVEDDRVRLEFHTLRFGGERIALRAAPESFVNSKGHIGKDDEDEPGHVDGGKVVAAVLREGAEMRLRTR